MKNISFRMDFLVQFTNIMNEGMRQFFGTNIKHTD